MSEHIDHRDADQAVDVQDQVGLLQKKDIICGEVMRKRGVGICRCMIIIKQDLFIWSKPSTWLSFQLPVHNPTAEWMGNFL